MRRCGFRLGSSVVLLCGCFVLEGCGSGNASNSASKSPAQRQTSKTPRPELKLIVPQVSEETSSSNMELVLIQPGKFLMGSSEDDSRSLPQEHPLHIAEIKTPFYLGKYEVTQEQYHSVMGKNPSWFCSEGTGKNEVKGMDTRQFPVESISWYEAMEYLNALSRVEELPPYYTISNIEMKVYPHENIETPKEAINFAKVVINGGPGYRFPTEEEWEYACRAGTETAWSFGDSDAALDDFAVTGYLKSGQRAHQKGEKKTNAIGLFDIHGNVAEFCANAFSEEAYRISDPLDESVEATHRVVRGGSWFNGPLLARCSARNGEPVGFPKNYVGLRVARNAADTAASKTEP